jgi:tRNA-splicing ligase RtcB
MTISIYGDHEVNTIEQMKACVNAVEGSIGVLCADGHKGYSQPVGGVVAYRDKVSISGVGYDIACGNLAIRTNIDINDVDIEPVMDKLVNDISFGVGRTAVIPVDHPLFDSNTWLHPFALALKERAMAQLGTVGSGNHYVDIFADENGKVWVGVHFGSRGLGHGLATAFLKAAGGKDGMDVPPTVVPIDSDLGQDYIACMELAGEYAYAGREYVARHVVKNLLGGECLEEVHNHHNYAWMEEHHGEKWWVVRKGATPAFPGQKGFVGGSMGDNAVILEGVDSEQSKRSLYSTVHGAGRVMGRMEAKGKMLKNLQTGEREWHPGKVSREAWQAWIKERGVCVRGGDVDEAPQAYRRLSNVLMHHAPTIKILHILRPVGVAMAGNDVKDPYKD